MTQILTTPVAAGDFEGGAGLDSSNGKPTLAERLMALAEAATYLGAFAFADLPEDEEGWGALGYSAMPDEGFWAFDTTNNAPRFWDGSIWRGATGAVGTASVAHFYTIGPVAAKGTNNVHALIDTALTTDTVAGFTNPDVPRNLRVVKSASWDGGTVTVTGTDQFDDPQTETFPALGAGTEVGTKIFKTVTASSHSIALDGGNGYSIGTGDLIGVPADLDAADTTAMAWVGTTPEAVTVDATEDAVTFTTVPAATTFMLLVNVVTS